MKLSDVIAEFINQMLEENGSAELRRAEVAERFSCVPSQINYVISSRFTPELGYVVQSQRGGGGYIRITRCGGSGSAYLMHVVNAVGDALDAGRAFAMLQNMAARGVLDGRTAQLMAAAVGDKSCGAGPAADRIRAAVFKNMLLALAQM